MSTRVSRRAAVKKMGAAGAGAVLLARWGRAQGGGAGVTIGGRPVDVQVARVSDRTVRLTVTPLADGAAAPVPADGSLVVPTPTDARAVSALPAPRRISSGDLVVHLSAEPLAVRVEASGGRLVQTLRVDAGTGAVEFDLGDGPVLGLGEGGPQYDRRGAAYRMVSGQGGYRLRTHGGRVPIQWLIGTGGWAVLVHRPYATFDLTGERGRFAPIEGGDALPLDVFVVGATEPADVMAEYARLTGRPELPPLWSLGYLQSQRTLAGPDEVMGIARTFREKKLPCDALIYLGTGFCPSGWNTNNGEFTWNPKTFPDPKKMIGELHAEHFKIVLHVVLEGHELVGAVDDPCPAPPAPGATGSGRTWPDRQLVACYWPIHKPAFDLGVDGWWPDQGDGLDAPSRLARIRMYWDGSRKYRPGQRVFALHRNGYAGMQRYAAFLWSGDVYSTWETLRTHVPDAVNTGLSGITYWGTDIGGFVPTREYTGELHVRWFQFGAFCPLFRAHGRDWHLRLPWGWNTGELGPNEISTYTGGAANPDPSELHNAAVEPICRKYLELRYRLLPYLYTAVREGYDTGLPVMRALWLHHADDPAAVARGDEYLWGRDMLVAPVTEPGATERRVYLPRGRWHDFWTETPIDGGREITRAVDLATMPLYVRAGAVLPLGPVKQYTDEPSDAPLALVVFPGADGVSQLYEDDGHTFGYQKDDWMMIEMAWEDAARRLTLRLAQGSRMRAPFSRPIEVRLAGAAATRPVTFAGRPVVVQL